MVSVTTDALPAHERAEFWADLVSRHVTPIRIEPVGCHPLHGEIQARVIGALGVARVSGLGVHASHTRAHIARADGHVYGACVHLAARRRELLVGCRSNVRAPFRRSAGATRR